MPRLSAGENDRLLLLFSMDELICIGISNANVGTRVDALESTVVCRIVVQSQELRRMGNLDTCYKIETRGR